MYGPGQKVSEIGRHKDMNSEAVVPVGCDGFFLCKDVKQEKSCRFFDVAEISFLSLKNKFSDVYYLHISRTALSFTFGDGSAAT